MSSEREGLLEAYLAEALTEIEAGRDVDVTALCHAHPELADDVTDMLALGSGLGAMHAASEAVDPFAGMIVADRYRLHELLGRGAAGSVYRARDEELGRDVAVKLLHAGTFAGSAAEERFLREAEILAQNEHEHVLRVYDRGRTGDGALFLVTELLRGVSLAQVLDAATAAMTEGASTTAYARSGWLADLLPFAGGEPSFLRRVVTWIAELGDGLAAAHRNGVFHRDVKPSNAFIRHDGSAVLLDFGIAARVGDASLTLQTSILGTPWYMAPEQARGRTSPSASLDVYGLSATLYHLCALRPPHGLAGDDVGIHEVLAAARDRDPVPAARLHPGLPRDLCAILDAGLESDPRHRYPSVEALVADLRAFLEHRPVSVRPLGPMGRGWRRIRRRPARALAIAGATAATVLLAIVLPLASNARAAASARERDDLLAALPADLCIEGWPDQRMLVSHEERSRGIAQLDRLIAIDPDDLAARLLRASERLDAGRRDAAAIDLTAIATRSPSPYLAAVAARYVAADSSQTGIAAVQLGDLPEPETSADCFVAGFHALRSRELVQALELLNRAEDYLPARDVRLLALLGNRRWDDAAREANWLEGRYGRPTARTRHTLAAAALGTRRYEDAIGFAKDALELFPDRHGPWNNLGYAHLRVGHLAEARHCLERAVAIRPWFDNSRAGLCQVLRSLDQFDAAREQAAAITAHWWREWELANVDLAEALAAKRTKDDARTTQLALAAAEGFARSAADDDPDNQKRRAAPASIAFAHALAESRGSDSITALLLAMRSEPFNPTQILNLCDLLDGGVPNESSIDALRLWLCEVGLDVAPDDQRLKDMRQNVREAIQQRSR